MWQLLAGALAVGGGLYLANQADTKAVNTATAGINNAAAIQQATDASIAASGGAGPGASYLRSLVASPGTLTPAQQMQLADLRRSTANQLHGSDFAGSGRAAAAVFNKTENEFTNTALAQNKQQAINAADKLEGVSTSAAMAGAQAGATAADQSANITAQGGLAQGRLYGAALGSVGSLIANQGKQAITGIPSTNTGGSNLFNI